MAKNAGFNREQFLAGKPIMANIGGTNIILTPKEFSTGSVGYSGTAKVTVLEEDGTPISLQCSINPTVIGSKDEKYAFKK